ncbi:MAG: type II toxin-antitoxin system RelE/ParE family toxin [Saprospiraceae bacterium]
MARKHSYEISFLAKQDLEEIWNYTILEWSVAQANAYYQLIFGEIDAICLNPFASKSIPQINSIHRIRPIKSHIIIYKIVGQHVYIDRILHQKMDIQHQIIEPED